MPIGPLGCSHTALCIIIPVNVLAFVRSRCSQLESRRRNELTVDCHLRGKVLAQAGTETAADRTILAGEENANTFHVLCQRELNEYSYNGAREVLL